MVCARRVAASVLIAVAIGCSRSAPPLDCRVDNPAGTTKVLMFGNSLLHDFDWPMADMRVHNCARQGQTLAEFMARWRAAAPLDQPDVVVIAFGTVEVIRAEQNAQHLQEFMALYPEFLTDLRKRWPAARLVVNLLPDINRNLFGRPNLDIAAIDQLNRFIRQSTNCQGCLVINLPDVLKRDERGFDETLTYDGVHLTERAYGKWLARLKQTLISP